MKKQLTALSVAIAAASLMMATPGFAHKNYKGESFKDMPAPCPEPKMLKDGFYAGIQGGYDSYRVRASSHILDIVSLSGVGNDTGWVGGLFVGYGKYLTDLFYLGGEVFANYNGSDNTIFSTSTPSLNLTSNAKFEVNGSYGLALLPGIRLNDTTLGYIRLGWNWANLKASANVNNNGTIYRSSTSNTSNGFNYGLGMETLLVDNWSLRTEYSHTGYSSFSTGRHNNSSVRTSINPSDNQFMLGLIYHFA